MKALYMSKSQSLAYTEDAAGSEDAPRLLGSLKARGGRGDAKDVKATTETEEEAPWLRLRLRAGTPKFYTR